MGIVSNNFYSAINLSLTLSTNYESLKQQQNLVLIHGIRLIHSKIRQNGHDMCDIKKLINFINFCCNTKKSLI